MDVIDEIKSFFTGWKEDAGLNIPISQAVIPTAKQGLEAEAERRSVMTHNVQIGIELKGEVQGLSPETKQEIINAVKDTVSDKVTTNMSLYEREGY